MPCFSCQGQSVMPCKRLTSSIEKFSKCFFFQAFFYSQARACAICTACQIFKHHINNSCMWKSKVVCSLLKSVTIQQVIYHVYVCHVRSLFSEYDCITGLGWVWVPFLSEFQPRGNEKTDALCDVCVRNAITLLQTCKPPKPPLHPTPNPEDMDINPSKGLEISPTHL